MAQNGTARREKRAHNRVAIAIPVSCELPDAPPLLGVTRDLGIGGAFIESSEQLAFGTIVIVVGRLPQTSVDLRLQGVVRWSTPDGFGVQFSALGPRETHAILSILK